MRVLHIGKFYPPFAGGMENFMGDLLPALERRDIRTFALVHDHEPGGRRTRHRPPYHGVYRVPCHGTLLYAPISPGFPLALIRAIRAFRPHILHMHLPNTSAFWAMAIPAARRVPWVVQWQSDVVSSHIDRRLALAYGLYRPLEQKLLKSAYAVIASSPPYLDTSKPLERWREKCRVIPLGLDPGRLRMPGPDTQEWAGRMWRTGKTRIISIGRLTYYKGHEILIKAALDLPEAHILIVGEGERKGHLTEAIRRRGLGGRVGLTGFLPDENLRALLATSDLLCLPSIERTEAFGLVLIEAMGYGKPVVASHVPGSGMGWIVDHLKTGILVKPGHADHLASALRLLCQRPDLRGRMARAGRKRFKTLFHVDQVAGKISSLYEEVLSQGAGGRSAFISGD
ncbi:MAG TPA: glycosyltransferase [Deltaproteobacteria bacterium]|nr:glycosyltransferase [Deltaproteobacteria bacterium]